MSSTTDFPTTDRADPEVERALEELPPQLSRAAGENLLGLALYGGLAKGRYTPGISDINVLVVLADASPARLMPLAPALTAAYRQARIVPFLVTPEDLRASALLFPIKVLDIQRCHRVLYGDVHLAGIEVGSEALRLRALQELKNLELRLRRRVVEHADHPESLWSGVVQSLPKLAVTLEALLRAWGLEAPATRPDILRLAGRELGIAADRMERVAVLRRRDPRPTEEAVLEMLGDYLALLAEVGRRIRALAGEPALA